MDQKIRVLIVDDSPVWTQGIEYLLAATPDLEVVGVAQDGAQAIDKVAELLPDVVTMDIRMPVKDGLTATAEIMAYYPTPILILSSDYRETRVFEALECGALDVMEKPENLLRDTCDGQLLCDKLRKLSAVAVVRHTRTMRRRQNATVVPMPGTTVIGVASSTGGPKALKTLLCSLPADISACFVVVQHMAKGFIDGLVQWLDRCCALTVRVAQGNNEMRPGMVLFAPDDRHVVLDSRRCLCFDTSPPIDGHRPSATLLFESIARQCGRQGIGVILTGIGNDGIEGLRTIKDHDGVPLCESPETATVGFMPRAAIEDGVVPPSGVLPLEHLAQRLQVLIMSSR